MLSIGLMSGTSMDGIDAAILETDGSHVIQDLASLSISYDAQSKILFKAAEYAVRKYEGRMIEADRNFSQSLKEYLIQELNMSENVAENKIIELENYLRRKLTLNNIIQHSTELHLFAVKSLLEQSGFTANQIDVIGYHGQTLFHRPSIKSSVIVGFGQYLADQLGITVVNDFRRRDILNGGQGAPLAPLYHQALAIRDKKIPVVIVNCGGIANITVINSKDDLIAFDTGPGNGLIDKLVRQRTNGCENMDLNGHYGQKGKVNESVLTALYEKSLIKDGENYYFSAPPKSLDSGDMKLIPELDNLSLEDACATLEAFTADTIVNSLKNELPSHWILAGGGWNNPVIRREFEHRLNKKLGSTAKVYSAFEAGWNNQAMEAQIFAYLAVRSLQNKALSLPSTTNVSEPLSGGHAFIPDRGPTKIVAELIKLNPAVLTGYQVNSQI